MKIICKTSSPNGRKCVGKDLTGSANDFGSAHSATIARDFTADPLRDFTVRRETIWESSVATEEEVNQREVEMIRLYRTNDPSIGYNRWPKSSQQLT